MSCEEQKLVRSIADALGCPLDVARMCWDAAARASSDHLNAADRGRARRAKEHANHSAGDAQPTWTWLDRVAFRTCVQDRTVLPQRIQRMLERLSAGVAHPHPTVVAAALRARQAAIALELSDPAAIAMLRSEAAVAAVRLASALRLTDAYGWPVVWPSLRDIVADPRVDAAALIRLGVWLRSVVRDSDIDQVWDAIGKRLDTDAGWEIEALTMESELSPIDILENMPTSVRRQTADLLWAFDDAMTSHIIPKSWISDSRWLALHRAHCRIMLDIAQRRAPWLRTTVGLTTTIPLPLPAKETLPAAMRALLLERCVDLVKNDRGSLYEWLQPWMDIPDMVRLLCASLESRHDCAWIIANRCGIYSPTTAWFSYVEHPRASTLRFLLDEPMEWDQCVVALALLPDDERPAAIQEIERCGNEHYRDEWALAAIWLWQDERAERMVSLGRMQTMPCSVQGRASAMIREQMWSCSPAALNDDHALDQTLADHPRTLQALAWYLDADGRFPPWAERAIRGMSDHRRDLLIAHIAQSFPEGSFWARASVARYLRSIGWKGDHPRFALVEAIVDNRIPGPDSAERLLRESQWLPSWEDLAAAVPNRALQSLWEPALRIAAVEDAVQDQWAQLLPIAPPPPHLRKQAFDWLNRQARYRSFHTALFAVAGIAIAASHPGWSLTDRERRIARSSVERALRRYRVFPAMKAQAWDALDGLDGDTTIGADRPWMEVLHYSPSNDTPETRVIVARMIVRRWRFFNDSQRKLARAWMRQVFSPLRVWAIERIIAHCDRSDQRL